MLLRYSPTKKSAWGAAWVSFPTSAPDAVCARHCPTEHFLSPLSVTLLWEQGCSTSPPHPRVSHWCANPRCYPQEQSLKPDSRHTLRQWQQWRRLQVVYWIGHTPEVHPQTRKSGWPPSPELPDAFLHTHLCLYFPWFLPQPSTFANRAHPPLESQRGQVLLYMGDVERHQK